MPRTALFVALLAAAFCLRGGDGPSTECRKLHPEAMTIGGDVTSPRILERAEPDGKALKESGYRCGDFLPIFQTVIDRKGRVACVRLIPPPGKAVPEAVARVFEDAVRRWEFKPATRAGEPVDVIMFLTLNFKCV